VKLDLPIFFNEIDAIQRDQVEVDIQVQCATEALNKGNRATLGSNPFRRFARRRNSAKITRTKTLRMSDISFAS
jgi:hypothetical protein